ncbi:HNH endonuclease [Sphingomonas oligophenolica]|uniref:HNH endonuclease n=2 Tax=Sphingomonas oligophenolica TaxID=301154 RepID=A0A502BU88_9SPHN|nr:HNH endonuclease [Sphingomonas oligophenolica]
MSKTDKSKAAYVPAEGQKAAIIAAGHLPSAGGGSGETIKLEVLGDIKTAFLEASFYDSQRKGANRAPETRMGRDIVRWAKVGDEIVIGNIGSKLFAAKADATVDTAVFGRLLAAETDPRKVIAKAMKVSGKPKRRQRTVDDFVRNPWVVAGALQRSEGKCELPTCKHQLFVREDGTNYLEVHHVLPLGEGGDDSLSNAAAICPSCHREQHFGENRQQLRQTLATAVAASTAALVTA